MVTSDEHRRARFQGKALAQHALATAVKCGALPLDLAESYARGMADGIREFVAAYVSDRAAYELLQQAADRVGADRVGSSSTLLSSTETGT